MNTKKIINIIISFIMCGVITTGFIFIILLTNDNKELKNRIENLENNNTTTTATDNITTTEIVTNQNTENNSSINDKRTTTTTTTILATTSTTKTTYDYTRPQINYTSKTTTTRKVYIYTEDDYKRFINDIDNYLINKGAKHGHTEYIACLSTTYMNLPNNVREGDYESYEEKLQKAKDSIDKNLARVPDDKELHFYINNSSSIDAYTGKIGYYYIAVYGGTVDKEI